MARLISDKFAAWQQECTDRFNQLKANEEELNRIFIDIYGLQDELTPEVEDKDVSLKGNTAYRYKKKKKKTSEDELDQEIVEAETIRNQKFLYDTVAEFLSYAVGCMFGRYSLDVDGLAYAGGDWDDSKYTSFIPDSDNVIPITDNDYFDDDIVERLVAFVGIVYGEETLGQNLDFIANAIYPNAKGTSKEKIRRYFMADFYKDHLKMYQKRPIYWMMDSAGCGTKKEGFKALFYLHRYDKDTIGRARTDYLHPLQRKYEAEIARLTALHDLSQSGSEQATYRKTIDKLHQQIDECRAYDQVVAYMTHKRIDLDLDDGVKVNYAQFQGIEVPQDNGKTITMDLLGNI
ncbi:hypothetical protein RFF05_09405 [Bengtsoniella intestinalis]|uniref:hypothetical protein n=1 Tax=Bengtsoniella intestinalis TaxID=3073143 RepID=UPI00391F22D5